MEYEKDKLAELINEMLEETADSATKVKLEKLLVINEKKEKRLSRIIIHNDRIQLEKIKKTKELYELSENLEKRIAKEILKAKDKDMILMKHSKLASMGEMMDAIAHQWKQPISIVSMQTDILKDDFSMGLVDYKYVQHFQEDVEHQISHMFSTLKEFRNFLRPTNKTQSFQIQESIDKALRLVKDEFMQHSIMIEKDIVDNFEIDGIENEFIHLILNIINNAKDALNENKIENKLIKIKLSTSDSVYKMDILDNAGGIANHIIDDIFKANVTTKKAEKGTGIGLYMSSQIAQKCNGQLLAENTENGARFTFLYN